MKKIKRTCALLMSGIIAATASVTPLHSSADGESEILSESTSEYLYENVDVDDVEKIFDVDKNIIGEIDKTPVNNIKNKISEDLKDRIKHSAKDEVIPIYIFGKIIPDKNIGELLTKETGIDYRNYENQDRFNTFVRPKIEDEVISRMGKVNATTKDTETMMSSIDIAVSENISNYKKERLNIIKREYSKANDDLIKNHLNKEREVRVNSRYFPVIITEATIEEIFSLAALPEVENIMLYEDLELETNLDKSLDIVEANALKSSSYNNGLGYKGDGIKIGIIEAIYSDKNSDTDSEDIPKDDPNTPKLGQFDPNAPHLRDIPSSQIQYIKNKSHKGGYIECDISEHATIVTSIIVGQEVEYEGTKYEGIVPHATVYQTSTAKPDDTIMAYNLLADQNVDVINYSGGGKSNSYCGYDLAIDYAISVTKIPFVVAAGNLKTEDKGDVYVYSPAKSFNAITVGNAYVSDKKGNKTEKRAEPYKIFDTSLYKEPQYLPNKPDIVAPGTYIEVIGSNDGINTPWIKRGTSLSTPIVTGLIAQLMQNNPFYKLNPLLIKAAIMLFADSQIIDSKSTNPTKDIKYLRDKSGAGMINAKKCLNRYNGFEGNISMLYEETSDILKDRSTYKINLKKGQKVRILLTFGKDNVREYKTIDDLENLDLYLYKPYTKYNKNNPKAGISASKRNNTEIIEYTAKADGIYPLEIRALKIRELEGEIPYALVYYIE